MWVFFFPAAELLLFRWWGKAQDSANIPPVSHMPLLAILLAFALFFQILLEKGLRPRPRPRWGFAVFHALLWVLLVLGGLGWGRWLALFGDSGARLLWYLAAFAAVGSSLLVWVDGGETASRIQGTRREALFLVLASSSFAVYESVHRQVWTLLSGATVPPVQLLLGWMGVPVQVFPSDFAIRHPRFEIILAAGCSGLEGMAFFAYAFFLTHLLGLAGRRGWGGTAAAVLAGIGWMFALNVLRIALFFRIAVWAVDRWGEEKADEMITWAFHSHAGWVIYSVGIGLFLAVYLRRRPISGAEFLT